MDRKLTRTSFLTFLFQRQQNTELNLQKIIIILLEFNDELQKKNVYIF